MDKELCAMIREIELGYFCVAVQVVILQAMDVLH